MEGFETFTSGLAGEGWAWPPYNSHISPTLNLLYGSIHVTFTLPRCGIGP